MRYQKFTPANALHPFVACYFIWEGKAAGGISVQSPPNSYSSIVFNYADLYQASQNNNPPVPVPRAFVSGQFTSNYTLLLRENIGIAGIVLKPSALHNFFGVRMSSLVNNG